MPVYEPQEDSELLRRFVEELAVGAVLDVGTGSGILAIAAARKPDVTSVLAVDVDDDALAHVRAALANEAPAVREKIVVRKSDLFAQVMPDERFDTIVCNPPYLPDEESDAHPALYGGPGGWELIARFLEGARAHLAENGTLLLLFSSLSNPERVVLEMKRNGYNFTQLAVEYHFFEQLSVYRLWRRPT